MNPVKSLLPLLALILPAAAIAQTGTGIVFLSDADIGFPPTPQDSTSTIEVTLLNDVGAEQTVNFSGLEPPFDADPSSFTLAANADTTITFSFTPTGSGEFAISATASGSVFGEATLNLSGEGTLVELSLGDTIIDFGTVPIGAASSQATYLSNSGTGTGTINIIGETTQGAFESLDPAVEVLNGIDSFFGFRFSPVNAGPDSTTMEFATNDPANPIITVTLKGTGISEVSGEICDQTWTAANSPYSLVGDVFIPFGCFLHLEPGTIIEGANALITCRGSFSALGTLDNPISISCLDFIYQNSTDTCQLQHTTVVESHSLDNTNGTADDNFEPIFTAYDAYLSENPAARYEDFIDELASTPPMYNNENGNLLGYYFENFDDNNPQGFSFSGTGFWNTNNSQISLTSNNSSSTWYNRYVVLPTFTLNEFESPDFIQFFINLDGNSNEAYFEVSIDNGSWTNVLTTYASQDGFKTIPINYPDASSIAFRIRNRYFYNANTQIDNISYHTTLKSRNLFTKSDLQQSGTGSLQISDSHFDGNLRIVCPQTSVHIESSTLTRQSSTMTSAALDIMTSNASIGIEESIITGHKLSALQIHANEVSLISTASNYSNNGLSNMRNALHIVADD